ncbi:type II toxin-antitoxin system RelE/ParE family toxin [Caulobacter ginsengisoli]|uniref:type II toxin-antitoxin system RelE/ParE family toxin n=1 Tax=Caulobacter ginsengisoli TaxID=400775 RepID=UPI003522DC43
MIRRVRILTAAQLDLLRLEDFLVDKAPHAAARAALSISQAIESLSELSERGRPSPLPGVRELVVPFSGAAYVIRYRVTTDEVIVARIFHSREGR